MRKAIACLLLILFAFGFSTSLYTGKELEPAILPERLDLEKILFNGDADKARKIKK